MFKIFKHLKEKKPRYEWYLIYIFTYTLGTSMHHESVPNVHYENDNLAIVLQWGG